MVTYVYNHTEERQILVAYQLGRLAYLNNARPFQELASKKNCKTKQSETRHTKVIVTKEWQIGYHLASS